MHIRPFNSTHDEYESVIAIFNRAHPYLNETVAGWKHDDKNRSAEFPYHRDVIEIENQLVAFGDYGQSRWYFHPKKYFWNVVVDTEIDGDDIRAAYFTHIQEQLANQNLLALTTSGREDNVNWVAFLRANGFEETMRDNPSELDLTTFDPTPFEPVVEKVVAGGIDLLNMQHYQQRNPNWQHDLWDLEWAIIQDMPVPDPPKRQSFEDYVNLILNSPNFDANYWTIALDGDKAVGLNRLWTRIGNPDLIFSGLTGVIPSYRRRGIATALKLPALKTAIKNGYKLTKTENEENNPMYQINLQLGFQPAPQFIKFEKQLHEPILEEAL